MNQASRQSLRPQCSQDWESRRGVIEQLYWTEDRELPEVMDIMTKAHGFVATATASIGRLTIAAIRPKQYKTVLKRWGLHKNVKTGEMKAIVRIQKRRRAHGKETAFSLRNRPVMAEKIERFLKRHDAQSPPSPVLNMAAAPTPADITYSTPAPAPASALSPSATPVENLGQAIVPGNKPESTEPMAVDDWTGLLGSSLHELRSFYNGIEVTPEPLPGFLEEVGDHGFDIRSCSEPATFAWQTMEHVAQQPGCTADLVDSADITENDSDDELYWSDCSEASTESLDRNDQRNAGTALETRGSFAAEHLWLEGHLHSALQSGNDELVREILSKSVGGSHKGMNVAHLAAFGGYAGVLRALQGSPLDLRKPMHGDLVHERGGKKMRTMRQPTALHLAVYGNHIECVEVLLGLGVDVDEKNGAGETPLMWAVYLGHDRIVDLLAERGACIGSTERFRSALCLAAKYGHDRVVKVLLERGANADDCGRDNLTPLQCALARGHHSTARLLLQQPTRA